MNLKINYIIIAIVILVIVGISSYIIITSGNQDSITIAGSTSVAPVAQALATAYMEKHPDVHISVTGGDSNIGVNSVRSGAVDIGTSSRNLTSSEAEGLTQYNIGTDAIAIIVNNQNPINNISLDELINIYTGNITNWNQLGGNDATITPLTRESGSGTRADFEALILGNNSYVKNIAVASSTYDELQAVAVSPNDIGYVARNALQSQVKVLQVDNVSLTQQNVDNGSYPLRRSMLFLVKGTPTGIIKDFIDFSLSSDGQNIINNVEYNNNNNTNAQNPGVGPSGAG